MNISAYALIPARYDSTRLPGKPLLTIAGKTVIHRVYLQTCKSCIPVKNIFVVTDSDLIIKECIRVGAQYIKIDEECENGTFRIAKACIKYIKPTLTNLNTSIVLNIQGDEPFINPDHINFLLQQANKTLNDKDVVCTTLHFKLSSEDQIRDTNIGKIILDCNDNILYCSRAVVPHTKSGMIDKNYDYIGHVGIFAFKDWYLNVFCEERVPLSCPVYKTEDIEWLKILEQSYKIKSYEIDWSEIGVNTHADYKYLIDKYEINSN